MNELQIKKENFMEQKEENKFCSVKITNIDEARKLYNALDSCEKLLSECVNEEIMIKDIVIEKRDVVDENGEVVTKYRTLIFDMDGHTYATGSYGIYNSISRLCNIFGLPTWNDGIKVKIVKNKLKDGKQSLSLKLV